MMKGVKKAQRAVVQARTSRVLDKAVCSSNRKSVSMKLSTDIDDESASQGVSRSSARGLTSVDELRPLEV